MKQVPHSNERHHHYGIKKLKLGVMSVLVATTLYFLPGQVVAAADIPNEDTTTATEGLEAAEGRGDSALPAMAPEESEVAVGTISREEDRPSTEVEETQVPEEGQASPQESASEGEYIAEPVDAPILEKPTVGGEALPQGTDRSVSDTEVAPQAASPIADVPDVPEGHFRMHFGQLPSENVSEIGVWLWGEGLAAPSQDWPKGAMRFDESKKSAYGYYLDVPVKPDVKDIHYLLNNVNNPDQKYTGDLSLEIVNAQAKQAWIDADYQAHFEEPLPAHEQRLRVHYQRQDGQYDGWALWVWGKDVESPSSNWPQGALDFDHAGPFGRYLDLPIVPAGTDIHFLLVNKKTSQQTADMSFSERAKYDQIYLHDEEAMVYTSPYRQQTERMTRAEITGIHTVEVSFTSVERLDSARLPEDLQVMTSQGQAVEVLKWQIDATKKKVELTTKEDISRQTLKFVYADDNVTSQTGWKLKDSLYHYEGPLGTDLHADGTATMRLWAPSADQVTAVLYDKTNPEQELMRLDLSKDTATGLWSVELNEQTTQLSNVEGYFYHYLIRRGETQALTLDPYAKSLAEWNQATAKEQVAKAAIVDPSRLGPQLDFAKIPGYTKREDAIIYEAHVRDFTSDPHIADQLQSPFGTFTAFKERLDYLKHLGVTHIQLMPIMSYYFANEGLRNQRELTPSTQNNQYNWGYDPQSYFSLSGMYTTDPSNPNTRIQEFKELVAAIHEAGMGVILDVVYNHTAKTHIFEDIEPGYYHFMNQDGTPRESFGGGRLGTTHKMARRVLVDSIKYWTDTFKVDGFRFDMMGDHDADAIAQAYREASALNPHMLMLGEGWRTYAGDEGEPVRAADQDWMRHTNGVGVFSDEIRNELKSGYPSEGEPRFLTGGARDVHKIFNNIIANPNNFIADAPGDVIQYIAAHDNLTLHDIIAQSIKKDPKYHEEEIHRRVRLGNLMVLTAQGTPFLHSGQEMGRTKQLMAPAYRQAVLGDQAPYKTHLLVDQNGQPFEYPYFVHDSYDSSDSINRFDWQKATDQAAYPIHNQTREYTAGLIALRRSTDAFRKGTVKEIADKVELMVSPDIQDIDKVIAYQATDSNGDRYAVIVNADNQTRTLRFDKKYYPDLAQAEVIADATRAGTQALSDYQGVELGDGSVTLQPLTATILRLRVAKDEPTEPSPGQDETPSQPNDPGTAEEPGDQGQEAQPSQPNEPGTGEASSEGKTPNDPTPGEGEQGQGESTDKPTLGDQGNGDKPAPGDQELENQPSQPNDPETGEVPSEGETPNDPTPGEGEQGQGESTDKPTLGDQDNGEMPSEGEVPSTPSPGEEEQSGQGETPSEPGDQGQEAQPSQPNEPGTGETPSEGETPNDPTPGEDEQPGQGESTDKPTPGEQGQEDQSSRPNEPGTSETPSEGEVSNNPIPGESEQSGQGESTDKPTLGDQDNGEMPSEGEVPSTLSPGEEEQSGQGETPSEPGDQGQEAQPSQPNEPGTGETLSEGETPNDPTPGESEQADQGEQGQGESTDNPTPSEQGQEDQPSQPNTPGTDETLSEGKTPNDPIPGEDEQLGQGESADNPTPGEQGQEDQSSRPNAPGTDETPSEGKTPNDPTPGEDEQPGQGESADNPTPGNLSPGESDQSGQGGTPSQPNDQSNVEQPSQGQQLDQPGKQLPLYETEGVKVTLNVDKTVAIFEDNDGDTRVAVEVPTKFLDPQIIALEVIPLEDKIAALGEFDHQAYKIRFLNKEGKEVPVQGQAKVIFPVDKPVVQAFYLTSDTHEIVNEVDFEMLSDGCISLQVNHFSLYAVSFGPGQSDQSGQTEQPVQPGQSEQPGQPEKPGEPAQPDQASQETDKAEQLAMADKGQTPTTMASLPETGEADSSLLFSGAALALLVGLGLVTSKRPEDC